MMELAMANQKQDYLQPLLDLMQRNADQQSKRMDGLEKKIDANTTTTNQVLDQAKYTNGRVTKAEKRIRNLESRGFKKLNINPNTLYMIALGCVIALYIIAKSLHIELGDLSI
jgi:septal ring factor EnvC (AmiA/AmiB activator)